MARNWPGGTTTDYLTIPASAVWAFNTNLCAMAIVRPSSLSADDTILCMGSDAGQRGWIFKEVASGVLEITNHWVAAIDATATTALIATEWLAVMVSWGHASGAIFKRYRYSNSSLLTETTANTSVPNVPLSGDTDNRIGQYIAIGAGDGWTGDIDRVLIGQHNGTPPSDAQFTAWARNGQVSSLPTVTVKGYWVLSPSGVSTNPEVDTSSNGLNITSITGTTAVSAFALPDVLVGILVNDTVNAGDLRFIPD